MLARPATTHPGRHPRARVTDMVRSLDFYLGLGCEVGRAADGWVLLTCGPVTFALVRSPEAADAPEPTAPWIRLSTADVRTLRRQLQHDGIPTGALLRPAHAPLGEIVVLDPDRRPVAIEQPDPAPRPARRETYGIGAQARTVGSVVPDPR